LDTSVSFREEEEDPSDRVDKGGVSMLDRRLSLPCLCSVKVKEKVMIIMSRETNPNKKPTHMSSECLKLEKVSANITLNDIKRVPGRTETIDWYVCWRK